MDFHGEQAGIGGKEGGGVPRDRWLGTVDPVLAPAEAIGHGLAQEALGGLVEAGPGVAPGCLLHGNFDDIARLEVDIPGAAILGRRVFGAGLDVLREVDFDDLLGSSFTQAANPDLREVGMGKELAGTADARQGGERRAQAIGVRLVLRALVALPVLKKSGVLLQEIARGSSVGKVAAGLPIEAIAGTETVSVPQTMLKGNDNFALTVSGNSMIEDGILDGDTIVVKKQESASNGETVGALIENEATVKRFYKKSNAVELHPANSSMSPIIVQGGAFKIEGVVVGLLRHFH